MEITSRMLKEGGESKKERDATKKKKDGYEDRASGSAARSFWRSLMTGTPGKTLCLTSHSHQGENYIDV